MNVAVPPFDDVHVRRAVAHALDEEELVARLVESRSWLATSQASTAIAHAVPDGMERDLLAGYDPYDGGLDRAMTEMRASAYDGEVTTGSATWTPAGASSR